MVYEEDLRWQRDARCKGENPRLFMPEPTDDNVADDIDGVVSVPTQWFPSPEAQRICAACPVRTQCLAWALDQHAAGVWAGTSDFQRDLLRRKYTRKLCVNCQSNMIVATDNNQVCLACGVSWFVGKM